MARKAARRRPVTPPPEEAQHPGHFVREKKLVPAKMSVTDAAKHIGISRPGVSNFLNGKVSATPEMAARIERVFGIPAQTLLDMQAAYDAANAKEKGAPANSQAYVPPFLAIKANALEDWASKNISARTRLAVLLRTLVHSTGVGLTKVDFPGNDDAERPGWDGVVKSSEGTPWIPKGTSGWEFGTNEDVKGKADKDFVKSVKAIPKNEREGMTFVFVSPRKWKGKKDWETAAKAKKLWKDVRAYDASDLEQWLAQSLPGQAWFANETLVPAQDVRSLDKCWSDWADVADPPLTGTLFDSAIAIGKDKVLARLKKDPDGPTIITADSTQEALAFIAQLLSERGGPELATFRDRVLVFDKPGVLPRLAQGSQGFIAVAVSRDVERELAPYSQSMHSIVVYPRNAANAEPHVVLEPVPYETFRKALEEMKKDRHDVSRLTDASGRSLTVLRRQLSNVPAVRTPAWAADPKIAAVLVPFLFVGAWNVHNDTDKEALSLLAGRPYDELEREFQALVQLDDTPVWSIGTFRGVISKIDLLYAIAGSITAADLRQRYFSMARMVLGEDNPALDLDDKERWAASIHGKVREFSGAFREGISETLVLLAVHGNNLFKTRLGVDTEIEAARVVADLLSDPLTTRKIEANDRDLPTYAEAAPQTFLGIIEKDLRSDQPAVLGLLRPVDSGNFWSSPSRSGLLWALEGLAWNPETLPRSANILARLAQVEIRDNWVNKPTHSLESIFRAWMPQTAANHAARVDVMKQLAVRFPDVAWKVCMAQFGHHSQIGDYSHKPRWRLDAYGFGEPLPTWGPIIEFMREMVEMALSWKDHSVGMLCDLVERLSDLDDGHQKRVLELVETWANTRATDDDKAVLREKIRISTLSRRAARRSKKDERTAALTAEAKKAYAALEPSDVLNKHAWLFREGWVEESADEIHDDEEIDFRKREERIQKLRVEALQEIHAKLGIKGLLELAERGKAAWQIGWLTAVEVLTETQLTDLLRLAVKPILAGEENTSAQKTLIAGALRSALDEAKRERVLKAVLDGLSQEDAARLYLLAPFRKPTWAMVEKLSKPARETYWKEVAPDWIHESDSENREAAERLVEAQRPRAALSIARFHPEKLGAVLLHKMLSKAAQIGGEDKPGHYQLEEYSIEEAFKHIDASPDLTLDQKAGLEFAYLDVLARPWDSRENSYGIPNLERYVEQHPEVYVQAVTWAYRRNDGAKDPPEFQIPEEGVKNAAHRGHKLLGGMTHIPGHDAQEFDKDRLPKWIATVRKSCAELSRPEVGDINLGKLLSHSPVGTDGVWPSERVRQVMEEIQSDDMMSGAHTGIYNSRGVVWRGEGGDQERELAAKYRKWGEALQFTHPFVSSHLLMKLAKTYEHEANREDMEAGIRRRLR